MARGIKPKHIAKKSRTNKSKSRLRDAAGKYTARPPPGPQISNGPSFLSLPAEIRNMIYRLLLVRSKPLGDSTARSLTPDDPSKLIWERYGQFGLSPAFLETCRQIYKEGSSMLYNENTFGIWIDKAFSDDPGVFLGFEDFFKFPRDYDHDFDDFPVRKLKNFHIVFDPACGFPSYFEGSWHVADVREFLSGSSGLDLSLQFGVCQSISQRRYTLGRFTDLKNVQRLTFDGPPCKETEDLKELMQYTPREELNQWFSALQNFSCDAYTDRCLRELEPRGLRSSLYIDIYSMTRAEIFEVVQAQLNSGVSDLMGEVSKKLMATPRDSRRLFDTKRPQTPSLI